MSHLHISLLILAGSVLRMYEHDSEHYGSCVFFGSLFKVHEEINAVGHKMQ